MCLISIFFSMNGWLVTPLVRGWLFLFLSTLIIKFAAISL